MSLVAACAPQVVANSSSPVRVLVYNIHAGKDARGVDNLDRVAAIVRESRADIALLQEVDRGTARSGKADQLALLASATGFTAAFGKTLDYQGGEYGIAVLSRWPIRSDTLMRLPVNPPQERSGAGYEPRGALRATIASPVGEIHVLNTHIDPSRDDFYRRQESTELLRVGAALSSSGALVILGGDLNSEPNSAVYGMFLRGGWTDAWKCGSGAGFTYPSNAPIKRIDYLLLSGALDCSKAAVISTEASDHRPVILEIARK